MITINTIELMKCPDWYSILLLVLLYLVAVFGLIWYFTNKIPFVYFVIVFALAFITLASDAVTACFEVPSGKFHIEATFTDDMPFNAVMKEYNIVEQRGDTFILEPKERNVD